MNYKEIFKVHKTLCKCKGAHVTARAIADMAGISEDAAKKSLTAMEQSELVDVVQVIDGKHGSRRHRCNAYMLLEGV